jgi:hypothetical protein
MSISKWRSLDPVEADSRDQRLGNLVGALIGVGLIAIAMWLGGGGI